MTHWTQQQLDEYEQRRKQSTPIKTAQVATPTVSSKPPKYRNEKTVVDGIKFDSKLEAQYYEHLKLRKLAGEIKYFVMQVSLRLEGGVRLRVDFMVVSNRKDGGENVQWDDVKGVLTPSAKNKIKQAKDRYGIDVRLIKKGMF